MVKIGTNRVLNFPFYWICLLCSWRDKSSYRSKPWVRCASGNVFLLLKIMIKHQNSNLFVLTALQDGHFSKCFSTSQMSRMQILIGTVIGDTGAEIRPREKRRSFVLDNRPNPIDFDGTRSRSARVVWLPPPSCAFSISSLAHSIFLCSRIQHFFARAFCRRWSTNRSEKRIDRRAH